jgi:hypothetical protein
VVPYVQTRDAREADEPRTIGTHSVNGAGNAPHGPQSHPEHLGFKPVRVFMGERLQRLCIDRGL